MRYVSEDLGFPHPSEEEVHRLLIAGHTTQLHHQSQHCLGVVVEDVMVGGRESGRPKVHTVLVKEDALLAKDGK